MGKPFFDLVAKYLLPYKDQILASMQRKAAKAAKNEEAAGVGTITKQNTTVDVNASTPYKNLKAFGLVKEAFDDLEEAIMAEAKQGKLTKRQHNATRGMQLVSDGEKWNGDYTMYRVGMAVAGTDGTNDPDIDQSSWVGKYKTTHPYTDQESDMLKKAYKAVGANYKDLNKGDNRSQELDSTNKTSPVPKRKPNQYGI
jgi:hypothetical protein